MLFYILKKMGIKKTKKFVTNLFAIFLDRWNATYVN